MQRMAFALVVAILGAAGAASAQGSGTALSLSFESPVVSCLAAGGTVTVAYTLSTRAVSQTTVTRSLTDENAVVVASDTYVIPAGESVGGWNFGGGSVKTHDGLRQYTGLPDGSYTLEVCAMQPGSGGNEDKKVCQTLAIVVACAEAVLNPCANTAPFGEVVGNTQIKAHATAQIQFRGNFGPIALVEIEADGFYRSATIPRNGESCTYHANWKFNNESGADFIGNAGGGVYTVKVSGNNRELAFPVTLSDAKGK